MNLKDFFRRYKNNEKKGFTVIEVLAVVVILSITSTAIVSVFMAVHKSVRETGTITSEQFHITQVERFIRNEFQVASNIDVFDIDPTSFTPNLTTTSRSAEQDDECMVFNPARKCVYFKKYDADAGEFKLALTVTNVEKVNLTICPYDYNATVNGGALDGKPLKLIYEIIATDYTYSGGMILGNTNVGEGADLKEYELAEPPYTVQILWDQDATNIWNSKCIYFHSEKTEVVEGG